MDWSIYLTQPSLLKVKQWGNNSFIALTFFKNVSLWLLESQGTSEIFTFNINRTLCKILLNTGNKSCYTRIEYEKIREYSVYMRIQEYTVMHFELIWIKSCIYIKNSISENTLCHIEHVQVEQLRLTLQRLQQHVKIKAKKCQFVKQEIRYLGRLVAADG